MANIDIGKRLKQVREGAGLNQRDFATRIASSSGRVSEIESGKNVPSGDLLLRLNQEFGTDLTWLLAGTKDGAVIPLGTVLTAEEQVLVDGFRGLGAPTRKRMLAFLFAGEAPGSALTYSQTVSGGSGQVSQHGDINIGKSKRGGKPK
jgi:transcriptional regulator with XRE-family HTH domain